MFSDIRVRLAALCFLALLLVAPAPARAQAPATDGWEAARWRFGPFAVTPRIELKNLGWDSNVFNDPADPKSDFTATAAVPIDWWLRFGRGRLHVVDRFEEVYYATYSNQGGFNQRHDVTLLVPLNRIRPYAGGYYLNTNDRPGYEINVRVRHTEESLNAGVVVRLAARLDVDVRGRQTRYRYDDQDYPGRPYSKGLNHTEWNYGAQASYRLTPLTSFTLLGDVIQERFTESPQRDNDGYRILPGIEFDPFALIKGKAQIGYRKLRPLTSGMPDFSGLVGNVDLSYVFRGITRLTVGVSRDIYFSYEVTQPFYIQPGLALNVTQQVRGPWDVQARAGWYRLEYQSVTTPGTDPSTGRVDPYQTLGGGVGYRLGKTLRVGFNIDYSRRGSTVNSQAFDGYRVGMSVAYIQ